MDKNSFSQQKCNYCLTSLTRQDVSSEWGEEKQHYKVLNCHDCGKKTWVKLDFDGSGHDFMVEGEMGELESMVSKVKGT